MDFISLDNWDLNKAAEISSRKSDRFFKFLAYIIFIIAL